MSRFEEKRHPIQVVSRQTGITQNVLRVWEKRYSAVRPGRTPTGRRLYSDADIRRLQMLRRAKQAGRRIGTIAHLSDAELADLIQWDHTVESPAPPTRFNGQLDDSVLHQALEAVWALDVDRLESILRRESSLRGAVDFIDRLVAPLVKTIGQLWAAGRMEPYQEHFTTAVVRRLLGEMFNTPAPGHAPTLLVTTLPGQRHEIGALLAAASAHSVGWRVLYLGPELPAADIARAAEEAHASVIALSIVYPEDDPGLVEELLDLRKRLPKTIGIFVGGAAAESYIYAIRQSEARLIPDLPTLRRELNELSIAP